MSMSNVDNLGTCRYYARFPNKLNRTIADPAELSNRTQDHTEFPNSMRYANVIPKGYRYPQIGGQKCSVRPQAVAGDAERVRVPRTARRRRR